MDNDREESLVEDIDIDIGVDIDLEGSDEEDFGEDLGDDLENELDKDIVELTEEKRFQNLDALDDDALFDVLDELSSEDAPEKKEVKQKYNYCTDCDSGEDVIEDILNGYYVCRKCGMVTSDIIDEFEEKRGFDDKETVSRCSGITNPFLVQSSLGTSIAASNYSILKKMHNWNAMPYKERALYSVLKEIQHVCQSHGIVKCIEDDAKILYKNISECKHVSGKNAGKIIIIRGKNRKSLIAACIYFACKRKGKSRSPKEIAEFFDLEHKDVTKGCKMFIKFIKIKKMKYEINSCIAEHFIPRFCRRLHMANIYIDKTVEVAKNIQKLNVASVHTPYSIAPASIMLVAELFDLSITKKQIAAEFDISEVTISKTCKSLKRFKRILLSSNLTDEFVKLIENEKKHQSVPKNIKNKYKSLDTKDRFPGLYLYERQRETLDEYLENIEFNLSLYDKESDPDKAYEELIKKLKERNLLQE